MIKNPYQQYKNYQYETASPEQLLLMLYDGAIKFARQTQQAIYDNDLELANNKLKRVQDIINELMYSLDMEKGGGVAQNLYKLYEYMNYRLIRANIRKDAEMVEEIIGLLTELQESWQEIITRLRKKEYQQTGGLKVE